MDKFRWEQLEDASGYHYVPTSSSFGVSLNYAASATTSWTVARPAITYNPWKYSDFDFSWVNDSAQAMSEYSQSVSKTAKKKPSSAELLEQALADVNQINE